MSPILIVGIVMFFIAMFVVFYLLEKANERNFEEKKAIGEEYKK